MRNDDRLKSLEARTYQAAMLQTAQSFGGYDTRFYASMLCGLAETMLQRLEEAFDKFGHLPDSEAPRHFVHIKSLLLAAKERHENESQNPTATP
jgi:hypothetical protein